LEEVSSEGVEEANEELSDHSAEAELSGDEADVDESDEIKAPFSAALLPVLLAVIGEPTHHSKFVAFQTPSSPIMEGIIDLHHDIMFFLVFVIVFVMYLMAIIMVSSRAKPIAIESETLTTEKGLKAATITPFIVSSHNTALEII